MTENKHMKGIACCADCAYYNLRKHRCTRGCKDEGAAQDHFYRDCPLPDVIATGADVISVVRCKDCKHRPRLVQTNDPDYDPDWGGPTENGLALVFPDDFDNPCPCKGADRWDSWIPNDDFYCASGERKENNG